MNQQFTPLQIVSLDSIPDSTYFRTGDVEPEINNEDRLLVVFNGEGSRRGWGRPGVTSTVVLETLDIVAVHVGFHHKHGGGQFWRYYQVNGDIHQVGWKDLDDDIRSAVLEAASKKAPLWAKVPGKLRSQYKSASPKGNAFEAYKVCGLNDDGELTSLYDTDIVYQIGKTKVEAAKGGMDWDGSTTHNGGWYVRADAEETETVYRAGKLVGESKMQERAALVRCECWGNRVTYGNGKMAVTYCKPLEVVKFIEL